MAAAIHPNTGPARRITLTDRGRRALALDAAGIDLPASYNAWGTDDSPLCENGHRRVPATACRDGGCRACRSIGVSKKRKAA